jgi:dimethylargininase
VRGLHALVRPPGASFSRAISSSRARIDVTLARAQHTEYCQALQAAGLALDVLPPDERYPDSCFMQDPALVIDGQGIVCRLGASSRQGEEVTVAVALAERGLPLSRIEAPGTLEGGDVLILPDRVLVGQTARSNPEGIIQLATIVEPHGIGVFSIPVPGHLHLLSAATYVGRGTLLALEEYADHPAFAGLNVVRVGPADSYAVNALACGASIVVPAGHPHVEQALVARGFTAIPVPTSEFAKADGGVTCLSLLW